MKFADLVAEDGRSTNHFPYTHLLHVHSTLPRLRFAPRLLGLCVPCWSITRQVRFLWVWNEEWVFVDNVCCRGFAKYREIMLLGL